MGAKANLEGAKIYRWARRFVSLLLLFGSGFYLYASTSLSLGTARRPGLGLMPLVDGIFLLLLSCLFFIEVFLYKKKRPEDKGDTFGGGRDFFRVIEVLSLFVFFGIVLGIVGYVLSSMILSVAMLHLLGMQGWMRVFLSALLISGGSFLLFKILLEIPLPSGILF